MSPAAPLPTLAGEFTRFLAGVNNAEPPEVVTGRAPATNSRDVKKSPHLAFVPLPDVAHAHAHGHLLGLAVLLPDGLTGEDRRTVLAAIARVADLDLPAVGRWQLERQTLESPLHGLLPATWIGLPDSCGRIGPSKTWATVTPMCFDRDPGDVLGKDAKAVVATACTRLELPAPIHVALSSTSFVAGVEHAREFPLFRPSPDAPRRRHVHVLLEFEEPVHGPLVIGAGRYLGYGLCRSLREGSTT